MEDNKFMTIKQVAQYLGMKLSTMYTKVNEIPHYRVGHLIRFSKEDVDRWMESKKEVSLGPSLNVRKIGSNGRKTDVDGIVRRTIDDMKGARYTSEGKSVPRIRGLRKGE